MKGLQHGVLCLAVMLAARYAAAAETAEFEPLQRAGAVLELARSRLPRIPLRIRGTLAVKAENNFTRFEYPVTMQLDWGRQRAEYALLDEAGRPAKTMQVHYPASGRPEFTFFTGPAKTPAELPDLLAPIEETDLSWSDLSLAFLWWPNARLIDYDRKRGFNAYLLEIPAPKNDGPIGKVRLWIHQQTGLLLETALYDRQDDLIKRLRVVSIKKLENGLSMVKDLEMIRPLTEARTRLRVDEVETPETTP
jgi:hypothetical protein